MAHVDDSFQEENPKEVESFIDEILDSDRHQGVHLHDASFDVDHREKTIPDVVEEMLNVVFVFNPIGEISIWNHFGFCFCFDNRGSCFMICRHDKRDL